MLVKTIKDYTDKETKAIYRTTDNCTIREVSNERGTELIAKGVAIEVVSESISKPNKGKGKDKKTDPATEQSAEGTEAENAEAPAEGEDE